MRITLPPSIRKYEAHLTEFVESMAFKLHVNAHKDDTVAKDIPILIDRMMEELQEFRDQLVEQENDPNTLTELADMGNFVFLLYVFMRGRGVMDHRERFISEYMRVAPGLGKIYCEKGRSGSRYRAGEEIPGTWRGGRCYIRTQHAVSGASVSLPRADIIWWATYGTWPRKLGYRNGNTPDDRIENLMEVSTSSAAAFPFVAQWKPKGKEDHADFGRWTYQRRHNMVLVKCGYYDTQEEAASQGLRDWKEKTRGRL